MELFSIHSISWLRLIITNVLVITGLVVAGAGLEVVQSNNLLTIPLIIGAIAIAIWVSRYTSVSELEIRMTHETLHIIWLKNVLFESFSEKTFIRNELSAWKYEQDKNLDLLKFTSTDGTSFRIWHLNGLVKDDFYKLVAALYKWNSSPMNQPLR